MPGEFAYAINDCDVPIERRAALQAYRDKRRLWLSWLETDEHHAIWDTLGSLVWTEVAFRALTGLAVGDDNALNNPLLVEALLNGHVATQVLAIRRLMEDTQKDRITLRRLVKDMKRNFALLKRENYVCFDGLRYDCETVRDAHFKKLVENGVTGRSTWRPIPDPEADWISSQRAHEQFDALAGIEPNARDRLDCLPKRLIEDLDMWLDESGADDLAEWSHAYLAHAGGPKSRQDVNELRVTAEKIANAIRVLARTAEAISVWLLNAGGRSSSVMPVAQFNPFEKLANPIIAPGGEADAQRRWQDLSTDWN